MNDSLKNSLHRHAARQQAENVYVPVLDTIDRFQGTWKDHVAAAKRMWGLMSERELIRSEGRSANLVWLLQGRYTMSPHDANKQVERFMHNCGV